MNLTDLRVKLFADSADLTTIRQLAKLPYIKGFTTNPTLMRKAGVDDYEPWARQVLEAVPDRPVSFEVLSDDFDEMERQAQKIASWGENVYVKIPITNTHGNSTADVIYRLSQSGIKVNVTAVMTSQQVIDVHHAMCRRYEDFRTPFIVSVFAGRIADTGCDPRSVMSYKNWIPSAELLWASTREVFNIIEADQMHCDIITVPDKILSKLSMLGKDLGALSLETVQQFYDDAVAAGYSL